MPTRSKKKAERTLLEIFDDYSPKVMSNGQIRMECPFRDKHKDGSGQMSFFVSPDINAYHCFSCKSKGNLVRLLTTKFGVNYFEAVGMVRLTDYKPEKKEFDLDLMWDVNTPPEEFLSRGYDKKTLKYFRVGMTEDGLICIPYYKDFSKPIDLLGYQTRVYEPDRIVRNSKGFDKKDYLYNLDFSYSYVVVVEGQSDVWRLHQFGYNATGLGGSDMSSWQSSQLSKFDRVYLALDNDSAGRRATEICHYLLKNHTDVRLVPYETKDPGSIETKKEWVDAFQNNTDYVVYSMEMSMGWEGYLEMRDEVIEELKRREL